METQTTATKQYAYKKARGFMAEQLKQVDDRPAMPESVCLKLVQSLIDDSIPYDAKIGVVDSTPILALHLKEAGFTNLTLLNNKEAKYRKTSTRVWLNDVNGFCTNNKISTLAFDLDMSSKPKFDIIIGNPPYGNRGNLAVKFLNLAFDLSDDVRLVMPKSVRTTTVLNQIRLDIVCSYDELLPYDTFHSNIQACYTVWTAGKREKIVRKIEHSDWTWVSHANRAEADVMIRRTGTRAGAVYLAKDFHKYGCGAHNVFLKTTKKVAQRLVDLEEKLVAAGAVGNGRAQCPKSTIVRVYTENYPN